MPSLVKYLVNMNLKSNNVLTVLNSGVHTLIQDLGRFGYQEQGLATGGPMDPWAFIIANRLCRNPDNSSALEVSIGGLQLIAQAPTCIVLTGAKMPLTVNDVEQPLWQSITIQKGDIIKLGYAINGVRSYLAIGGGFKIKPQFGSTSTVCREGIGGLNGKALIKGDILPFKEYKKCNNLRLAKDCQPYYNKAIELRVVLGYQYMLMPKSQLEAFFNSEYKVSKLADRMGYRFQGTAITTQISSMLSEGICYGAIQIPDDGQPIIMLNDRQTIGGYPKLGSIIYIDGAKLAQLTTGNSVSFKQVTLEQVNEINKEHQKSFKTIRFEVLP